MTFDGHRMAFEAVDLRSNGTSRHRRQQKDSATSENTSAPSLRQSAWVQAFKRRAPGGPCFDPWSAGRIRSFLASFGKLERIVDVGSSSRVLDPRIIRFDLDHGAGVTVVGDGHQMPFAA